MEETETETETKTERERERESLALIRSTEKQLSRRFPDVSDDRLHDSAVDAVLDQRTHEGKSAQRIARVIAIAARRNVIDATRSESARRHREIRWSGAFPRASSSEEAHAHLAWDQAWIEIEALMPDDRMREVSRLWRQGERDTDAYASVLSLEAKPRPERAADVKREKDRHWKFLTRNTRVRLVLAGC